MAPRNNNRNLFSRLSLTLRCFAVLSLVGFFLVIEHGHAKKSLPPRSLGFSHLSLKDGLSNPVIYDIKQDKHGYIWFATGNGLSRYDGYGFKNYLPDETRPDSIGQGAVIQLYMDNKSRMWAVVVGSGLFLYNDQQDNFIQLQPDPEDPIREILSTFMYSISQDRQGNFWISTVDSGLLKYNETRREFTHYRHDPENRNSLSTDKLAAVFVDSENTVWISCIGKGLNRLDISTGKFTRYYPDLPPAVAITEDKYGDLWIPTLGEGVVRYVRDDDRFIIYKHDPGNEHSLSHNQAVKVLEDQEGTVWISTWGGGINVFDRQKNNFIHYKESQTQWDSLSSNNTWGLFADKSHVLWVGTYGAGINTYDRKRERFESLDYFPEMAEGLPDKNITALARCKRGFIWIGSLNGGLTKYDPYTEKYTHLRNVPGDSRSISSDNIWKIAEDSKGHLWIATEKGLNAFNPQTGMFTRYLHQRDNINSLGSDIVRSVMVDSDDFVWIGTQNKGIDRFDPDKNLFTHYQVKGAHHVVLYQDAKGTIWSGNAQTLNYYDRVEDTFVNADELFNGKQRSCDGFYTSIKEDGKGRLWFGTTSGLRLWDRNGKVIHYGKESGLPEGVIADFQFDGAGRIWISNSHGLTLLDLNSEKSYNFDIYTFNRGASLASDDGTLFFGGLRGVISFHPTSVSPNSYEPPIVITQFDTLQKSYAPYSLMDKNSSSVELTHKDRFFSIGFAALDYSNPVANSFLYKLEGFDNAWRKASGKNRFVTYTNLDAGEYLFRVVGSNNEGVWNMKGASLKLRVLAPWWRSWWFISVAVGIPLMGLSLFFYIKTSQLEQEKTATQKLRESEEKFKLLFENSPLGIVHFDHDGVITTCNDAFAELTKENKEDLTGCHIDTFLPSLQMQFAFNNTLSGGTTHYDKNDIVLKNKDVVTVRAMIGPVYSSEGQVTGGVCTLEDISEGVKAEKEKLVLEKKLQHALKMEAIGNLAGGIAHDFNNILSAILGNAEIAKLKLRKNDSYEDELDGIFKAGLRAKELVQHILAFSRKSDTRKEVLQPSLIVSEGARLLRSIIPSTISMETEISTELPNIMADPAQVHQIVMNLCTNGLHAMEKSGGTLKIELQQEEITEPTEFEEPDVAPGNYILLRVTDSGEGIVEDQQDRIFEPYYTTKGTGKGTGLGLSIVHGIVQSCNGFIYLRSRRGKGTVVNVLFPVYSGESKLLSTTPEAIPTGSENILFVDDEESIVEVNSKILEELGYNVTGVTSSIQALNFFSDNPKKYDLVITDYTMPQITGARLASKLLKIRPSIPIILCTGYSANISKEKAEELGVKAFLQKPLVKHEIATQVRRALAG